jgi:hypothetical protein
MSNGILNAFIRMTVEAYIKYIISLIINILHYILLWHCGCWALCQDALSIATTAQGAGTHLSGRVAEL